MIDSSFQKCLVFSIVVLFLGVGSIPIMACDPVEPNTPFIGSDSRLPRMSSPMESRGIEIILSGELGQNGWYIGPVSFEVIGTNGTVVTHFYYRINGGGWTEFTSPVVFSTDGIFFVEVMALDQNGTQYNASIEFKIDMTPPTIALQKDRVSLNKITFVANVSDAVSGVWVVQFYLNCALVASDYDPPYEWTWEGVGSRTVTVTVFDIAGNSASASISTPCLYLSGQMRLVFQHNTGLLQILRITQGLRHIIG
jgi:hypothetical protein